MRYACRIERVDGVGVGWGGEIVRFSRKNVPVSRILGRVDVPNSLYTSVADAFVSDATPPPRPRPVIIYTDARITHALAAQFFGGEKKK